MVEPLVGFLSCNWLDEHESVLKLSVFLSAPTAPVMRSWLASMGETLLRVHSGPAFCCLKFSKIRKREHCVSWSTWHVLLPLAGRHGNVLSLETVLG